jgi:hypothetical protein
VRWTGVSGTARSRARRQVTRAPSPCRLHKARTRGLETGVEATYLPIANWHTLAQLHNARIRALGRHFVSHFTAAVMMIRTIAMAYNTYTHNHTTSDYPRNQAATSTTANSTHSEPKTNQPNNDDDDPRFHFRFRSPKNQNISTFPHTKSTFEQEEGIKASTAHRPKIRGLHVELCTVRDKGRVEGRKMINGACR